MASDSVDALQRALAETVFNYAKDRKKAAGRALGTLVELVAFYTLRAWDLRDYTVIERRGPEFANPDTVHNVESSLHPALVRHNIEVSPLSSPLTAKKISKHLPFLQREDLRATQVVTRDGVKRNASVLIECKRVGVEDGMKKGPQTIEKA